LLSLVIALIGVTGLAVGYGVRQQSLVNQVNAREADSNATMIQMRNQVESLTAKLEEITAAQKLAEQPPPATPPSTSRTPSTTTRGRSTSGGGKQIKQLQAQLSDQQKQLANTQDQLSKTRTDLETTLSATRDDLNGSIARTHEEVVALAKRGERNIFEFDLDKSRDFERAGPLSISLRKADTKHGRFDLSLIVDDVQLSKKGVNLYEPIWIHRTDDSQPVQIVINKIEKNHVHGYVSASKYSQSELSNVSYSAPANSTLPNGPSPSSGPLPSATSPEDQHENAAPAKSPRSSPPRD
jgi:hypothetical protein